MKDIKVADLLRMWKDGKRDDVLNTLEEDHAGLTAMFITAGSQHTEDALRLTVSDCNIVTNLLMDRRIKLFQAAEAAKPRYNMFRFAVAKSICEMSNEELLEEIASGEGYVESCRVHGQGVGTKESRRLRHSKGEKTDRLADGRMTNTP